MSTRGCRVLMNVVFFAAALLCAAPVFAQVPAPTPNPAAPPGTEKPNPQAPPATQPSSPTAPPGQPTNPGTTPQTPPAGQPTTVPGQPTTVPGQQPGQPVTNPQTAVPSVSPTPDIDMQEPREPNVNIPPPKPLPPLPNLSRLGVVADSTLPL